MMTAVHRIVGRFDVEAALRRHLVRRLTDKLAATTTMRGAFDAL
jgi:hypothetical protein